MGILDRAELLLQAKNYSGSGDWLDESGNGHDAQFGSTSGADTNDPQVLAHDGDDYVYLPGVGGNYLSLADHPSYAVTDCEVAVRLSVPDLTPSAQQYLCGQWTTTGDQRSWYLAIQTDGDVALVWSELGTNAAQTSVQTTGIETFATIDVPFWLKATLDVDDGAADAITTFYYSLDDTNDVGAVSWIRLGDPLALGSTTQIHDSTGDLEIGGIINGGLAAAITLYAFTLSGAIGGAPVADVILDDATEPFATFTERSANAATVTINRSGSGLYVVDQPAFGLHTDNEFRVANHTDLNLAADGDLTMFFVVRQQNLTGTKYLSYKQTTPPMWGAYITAGGVAAIAVDDGVTALTSSSSAVTAVRERCVSAIKRDTVAGRVYAYMNASSTVGTVDTTGDLTNTDYLPIGSYGGGGYNDVEIMAVALFREALTDTEILQVGGALSVDRTRALHLHGGGLFSWLHRNESGFTSGELVGALNQLNGTKGVEYRKARRTYLGLIP